MKRNTILLQSFLVCLFFLSSCSNKQEVIPNTENQVKELLAKYENENYTLGSYDADSVELKSCDLEELEIFLKELAKVKSAKTIDSDFVSIDDDQNLATLDKVKYAYLDHQVTVRGSKYCFPCDEIHFEVEMQLTSYRYGLYTWNPSGINIYNAGVMPSTASRVTYRQYYSIGNTVLMDTWFVLCFGVEVRGLPLYFSEKMHAVLSIDMHRETLSARIGFLNQDFMKNK